MKTNIQDDQDELPPKPTIELTPLEQATNQMMRPGSMQPAARPEEKWAVKSIAEKHGEDADNQAGERANGKANGRSIEVSVGQQDEVGGNPGIRARAPAADEEPPEIPEGPEERWKVLLPRKWMLRYCIALRTLGVVGLACRDANVSRKTVSIWRGKVPEFDLCCQEAAEDATDAVEAALRITATVGDPEPVYQAGALVGYRRRKDSKAADILLRAKRPEEYRPDYQGAPTAPTVILASPEAVAAVVRQLSPVLGAKQLAGKVIEAEVKNQ